MAGQKGVLINTQRFIADVLKNRNNAAILQRLDQLALPDAWLVAGCLFQTVWNLKSGQAPETGIRDYDIFYFDERDLSEAAEAQINARAAALFADLGVPLEVKNQARVHTWYEAYFGRPYAPLTSTYEGIDRFLVDCTSIGIRRIGDPADAQYEVYAPNGLIDTYSGVLVCNSTFDNGDLFDRKCRDYLVRWPWLTVQESDFSATESDEVLRLTPRDQQTFADALLMPPAQSPTLKRAFESASKLIQRQSTQFTTNVVKIR